MKTRLGSGVTLCVLVLLASAGCVAPPIVQPATPGAAALAAATPQVAVTQADVVAPKDATLITQQANAALLAELPFADQQDFEDAQRGFIATLPEVVITAEDGQDGLDLEGIRIPADRKDPLPTVNPSLWRMAQLNMTNGLFQVTDRIYQVRGFDVSNMTIVEGDTGVILIDPLSTVETARAALDLYYQRARREAGSGGDLYAQPPRPLRRRQGCYLRCGCGSREGRGARAGGVHGGGGQRERLRRQRHEPAHFAISTGCSSRTGETGAGRRRARQSLSHWAPSR